METNAPAPQNIYILSPVKTGLLIAATIGVALLFAGIHAYETYTMQHPERLPPYEYAIVAGN